MALCFSRKPGQSINIANDTIRISLVEIYNASSLFNICIPEDTQISLEIFKAGKPEPITALNPERITLKNMFKTQTGQNAVEFELRLEPRENVIFKLDNDETIKFGHRIRLSMDEITTYVSAASHIKVNRQEIADKDSARLSIT